MRSSQTVGHRRFVAVPLGHLRPLGRFAPDERAALIDLQPPARPTRVEPYEVANARIGDTIFYLIAKD
ncbi:hypothetical protein [Propionibacterium sp. oral taxon 192]|uniref:hypothetical protein n=1 Tax=Propionibacterium sp. oral taxon 192 TaxID=671222 RepID=UPI00055F7495|nr:hypothetical protein [Propionibacterium sp. oral taxon 192]